MIAAELHNVSKSYQLGNVIVKAVRDVSVRIESNALTVISGASGSGKTTLLNLIGCIDKPDEGSISVASQDVKAMSDNALSDFRARSISFVFQNFNLLPVLSVDENVEYPMILAGVPRHKRQSRVAWLLNAVGLAEKAKSFPNQLSGGQRQRVAIARALAVEPALVLADEPTANLDTRTAAEIIELMRAMQREKGSSFVICSHDSRVMDIADHRIAMRDGAIVDD